MSVEEIKMPQLGESVTEGTIIKWLVSIGEQVKKYQPLAEIMTDKVTAEIPSTSAGIVKEILVQEDETVKTDTVICLIDNGVNKETASSDEGTGSAESRKAESLKEEERKVRYSPAVLKLSQEHGLDLKDVPGTGANGRVTRKDVLNFIAKKNRTSAPERSSEPGTERKQESLRETKTIERVVQPSFTVPARGDKVIPVKGIRKAIAENMTRSYSEIPHAWTMVEADVTDLVAFRNSMKEEFKRKEGLHLTYFPFFIKAAARALKEFPQINTVWNGDSIIEKNEINISVAVAADDGLYVPVIKAADEKTVKGIARELNSFAEKAKSGTFTAEDMQGGTFTINNTGTFGSIQSRGIINHPQAAILQVEKIVKRPVVIEGMIAIRDMVNLCMSIDHRILDGLISGRFLQRVKELIENISQDESSIY